MVRKCTMSREPGVEIFPCAHGSFLLPKRCTEAAEAPASPSTESLKELLYWEDRCETAAPMPGIAAMGSALGRCAVTLELCGPPNPGTEISIIT